MRSEPRDARIPVWALPISLAATLGIDVSFSSSGYLDVSVHRVPPVWLWIHHTVTEVPSAGFPHSDICGSQLMCSSPQLFAAYHVFLRLSVPRHPPCALLCLTSCPFGPSRLAWRYSWPVLVLVCCFVLFQDNALHRLGLGCLVISFVCKHRYF